MATQGIVNTEFPHVYFSYALYPNAKWDKIKDCFTMTQRISRTVTCFNACDINFHCFLSKAIIF